MAKKTNNQLALEVLCGKWGSGETRKKKLVKAGYDYYAVQKIVNDRMKKKAVDVVAQEVIGGKWGNGDVRKKCLTVAGYKYATIQNKVNEILEKDKTIIDKELEACKVQADWMKNYVYGWQPRPTIEKSKKKGTCVTYVACVLQRIGLLKSGEFIWHDSKGRVDDVNPKKLAVSYPKGTIKANKSKLKAGDIILAGDKSSIEAGGSSHIFIFTGKWSGDNPIIWDQRSADRVRKGQTPTHTWNGKNQIIGLVRPKA